VSGPATALPAEIAELMTVGVTWEHAIGTDGYGQPHFAAPVTLKAWVEEHGMIQGGLDVIRKPDGTMVNPQYDLFFDGDDSRVQSFTLQDRFTLPSIVAGATLTTEPLYLSTKFGPPFDNQAPWLVQVTL
jgi:hypothetical protein